MECYPDVTLDVVLADEVINVACSSHRYSTLPSTVPRHPAAEHRRDKLLPQPWLDHWSPDTREQPISLSGIA
jgi:hypothetical protein